MAVFVDAGLAANRDSSSLHESTIILLDKNRNESIVYYGNMKAKHVIQSAFAPEFLPMIHDFHIASTIRISVNSMLHCVIRKHVLIGLRGL